MNVKLGYVVLLLAATFNMAVLRLAEVSYERLSALSEAVNSDTSMLRSIEQIRFDIVEMNRAMRGFLITADPTLLGPLRDSEVAISGELKALDALIRGNHVLANQMVTLRRLTKEVSQWTERMVEEMRTEGFPGAQALIQTHSGRVSIAGVLLTLSGMHNEADRVRRQDIAQVRESEKSIRLGVLSIAALNILLVSSGAVLLWRDLRRQRQEQQLQADREAALAHEVERQTAQLRELSNFLENIREAEKQSVARELHDELGGTLTAAKIDLQLMSSKVQADLEVATRLQRVNAAIDEAITTKRRIIENLRPTLLEHLGIGAALRWQCEQHAKRTGSPCKVTLAEDELKLSPELSIAIYRIVQEALTNITKYAKAKSVEVSMLRAQSRWHLRIRDDGVGIDTSKRHNPTSHGLIAMRERVRALNGELRIAGRRGAGTTIDVWLPVEAAAPATQPAPAPPAPENSTGTAP